MDDINDIESEVNDVPRSHRFEAACKEAACDQFWIAFAAVVDVGKELRRLARRKQGGSLIGGSFQQDICSNVRKVTRTDEGEESPR
jgi:hypothetical protein